MNKIIKHTCILLLFSFVFVGCKSNQKNNNFELKQGDLLFQNTGTGEIDNAIKDVTATSLSKNYSHVGLAMQEDDKWFVVEAIPKEGICQTPLKKFLNRNKNKFNKSQTTVARLHSYYQPYISKAIAYGIERIDTPYDEIFLWDDNSYYCSELVYKMFSSQDLSKDAIPFLTHPMTFNDSTGNPMPSWKAYYKTRNQPIPEGIEGTNPNLMASSPRIKFVHDYENE
ncbi:YiiX/YebB-like N1pC/P60 family cysteine hydrolase [Polaribacter sp. SA4-12]|uniref:YiiX/YebB-like N1pC/P60 family cysteine hydrolase n=1 Tax=Polaribacter sp. SA4-12 TaxID=1312072 RepID=UPI001E2B4C9E|nr:YiiX/YebB-like N1pC/P60 family cysteine hydrolase [Polaribacter sp. SA4-12]